LVAAAPAARPRISTHTDDSTVPASVSQKMPALEVFGFM